MINAILLELTDNIYYRFQLKESVLLRLKRFTTLHNTTLFRRGRIDIMLNRMI